MPFLQVGVACTKAKICSFYVTKLNLIRKCHARTYECLSILRSNIPDEPDLLYELVTGRTEQTNKLNTFVLSVTEDQQAQIKLGRYLDYESVSEYLLTVRVQNKYNLAAETQINVHLLDVNDNIPAFTEMVSGSVLEKEPRGTPVMQVRALDADGTSDHNQVTTKVGKRRIFETHRQ